MHVALQAAGWLRDFARGPGKSGEPDRCLKRHRLFVAGSSSLQPGYLRNFDVWLGQINRGQAFSLVKPFDNMIAAKQSILACMVSCRSTFL